MREIPKLPILTANKRLAPILLGLVLYLAVSLSGCIIKGTSNVPVPAGILNAKTAGYDELLGLVGSYNKINELSSGDLKLSFERKLGWDSQKGMEKWERWHSAPGYILLKRPDSVRLALKSPMSTEFEMASVGDDLFAWIPSKNRYYIGKNSAKELSSEGITITMRGPHIFEAVFPQIIDINSPEIRISVDEAVDTEAKYYIISFYKDTGSRRIHTIRKFWIERSQMAIVRQQFFLEDGRVECDVKYSEMEQTNGFNLPLKIHMDRPLDGYELTMQIRGRSWRINSGLKDGDFILPTPEKAEIIHLNEKTKNGTP
jgi:hypothetical protein